MHCVVAGDLYNGQFNPVVLKSLVLFLYPRAQEDFRFAPLILLNTDEQKLSEMLSVMIHLVYLFQNILWCLLVRQ